MGLQVRTQMSVRQARRGVVMLAVLVVIVLMSLAAYHYSDFTLAEYQVTEQAQRLVQARAVAASGIHYTAALLSDATAMDTILHNNPYHQPSAFVDVTVQIDDKKGRPGKFVLIAPPENKGDTSFRHGVTDEGGKINLNAVMKADKSGKQLLNLLNKLPNMTPEIAACIVDWLDTDSTPGDGGAEDDYYSSLSVPYRCKNGPLDSLEELLLVKGVTPELLFGLDRNRNGMVDPEEDDGSGTADLGWAAYLTIYSREDTTDEQGQPLTYLNDSDMATLYDKLTTLTSEDLAKFVLLYRNNGSSSSSSKSSSSSSANNAQSTSSSSNQNSSKGSKDSSGKSGTDSAPEVKPGNLADLSKDSLVSGKGSSGKFSSVFDLIDAQVSVPGKDNKSPTLVYQSPLTSKDASGLRDLLPKLLLNTTASKNGYYGRVNIITAPQEVLTALPNLAQSDIDTIVSMRPSLSADEAPDPIYKTLAWLVTDAKLPVTTVKNLEKYITTRSAVYRVQVVGTLDVGMTARVEAVIDTNGGQPRFLLWRDLTELGKGGSVGP